MSQETTNLHAELEERLRFETLLADLSSRFVNLPTAEVDREILDAERRIADRREGVGCDQLILIEPAQSRLADAFMRIRNADGGG